MQKRYILITLLIFVLILTLVQLREQGTEHSGTSSPDNAAIHTAFEMKHSDIIVTGAGRVVKILADDLKGSKHQRFIVELDKKLTVLVAHNIDIAPRITTLRQGDHITFRGEYEWNRRGGVIHWTHHDPAGRHTGGWLNHDNTLYQ